MIKLQDMLFEIGEGITPYTFRQIANKEDLIAYTFDTEADDRYIVKFELSRPHIYDLSFYPGSSLSQQEENDKVGIIMNKGNAFRVMSTVVSFVKTLISKNKKVTGIDWIGVLSSKMGAGDQREKLYNAYLQKNIDQFPNWKIQSSELYTKIRKIK